MSKEIQGHVLAMFEVKQFLGSGAYGHVWKVCHRDNGKDYALKKVFDAFQNDVDAQRTYREVTILHQLDHQNIVKLQWVIKAHNGKDLYLVFEFIEADLHSIIGENILGAAHVRFIAYQICKVLKYLHSAHLIHRDLKSSNVLINSNCEVKICDFGLVRSLSYEEDSQLILSEDVATRWYRSPQMLLGSKDYGPPTDIWSLGCILAEIVRGEPLFPGTSSLDQIERILQFTGIPTKQSLNCFSEMSSTLLSQMKVKKRPFKHYFTECDPEIKQLILRMLQIDSSKRITADEVLELPYLQEFRRNKESVCKKYISLELDENRRLDVEDYKRTIYRDIERRYPTLNKPAPPMPRIQRSFHSLSQNKFYHSDSLPKRSENPQFKAHNSTSLFHKSYFSTNSTTPGFYKKQLKSLASFHNKNNNNKENLKEIPYCTVKSTIHEQFESTASKIIRKKAGRNLWRKDD